MKLCHWLLNANTGHVAPYVGAWIETRGLLGGAARFFVAPYVGAWIETRPIARPMPPAPVAPYVGAWIETPQ